MKKLIILATLIISFGLVKAQPFEVGTNVLGLSAGIGGYYRNIGLVSIPTIGISYDHGFKEGLGPGVIGIGGYFGYKSSSSHTYTFFYDYHSRETYLIFGARGTYHYNFDLDDHLDLYGGLLLSYINNSIDDPYYGNSNSGYFFPSLFVGGSYYFTDNIAVFSELGYGITYCTVGIDFKF